MLKKIAVFILLLALSSFLMGISALILSPELRYFLYKEISYQYIADRLTKDAKTEEEKVLKIFDYIHENLNAMGGEVIDKDTWNDLFRGIAWCDQQSWALATLLSKENISGRIVMLRNKEMVSTHTIAEVFLKDRWIALDPLYGLVFRKDNGSLATLEEISQNPEIIAQNPKVLLLSQEKREEFLSTYSKVIPLKLEPKRWGSLLKKKNRTRPQRALNLVMAGTVRICGRFFTYPYQDLYLSLELKSLHNNPERLYFKARNYHLYSRTNLAKRLYEQIIREFPDNELSKSSKIFLTILEIKDKDFKHAIIRMKDFLSDSKNSQWNILAHYYLGAAYEGIGDFENARLNYAQASSNLDTDAVLRLSELKGIRQE